MAVNWNTMGPEKNLDNTSFSRELPERKTNSCQAVMF